MWMFDIPRYCDTEPIGFNELNYILESHETSQHLVVP